MLNPINPIQMENLGLVNVSRPLSPHIKVQDHISGNTFSQKKTKFLYYNIIRVYKSNPKGDQVKKKKDTALF